MRSKKGSKSISNISTMLARDRDWRVRMHQRGFDLGSGIPFKTLKVGVILCSDCFQPCCRPWSLYNLNIKENCVN